MLRTAALGLCLCLGVAFAQGPVILQRGVVNAVTLEPAPSRVSPGDILLLRGLNLGPADGATSSGAPLPVTLGEVQVLIANRPAPIFSVAPDLIRVQVPFETAVGQAEVVVQRGDLKSRPAFVRVVANAAGARTKNNLGYGEAGVVDGQRLTLSMTGLGLTEPRVATGDAGPADAPPVPRQAVRANVGGFPATVQAALSSTRVGEFDVTIDLPEGSRPGDIVSVSSVGAPVTRTVLGSVSDAVVQYARLPAGFRDVRALRQSDLRGNYVLVNGPRGADGCFPTWVFDLSRAAPTRVEPCLIAQANAVTAVNALNESPILAAFTGPASDQPNLISSKVALFNPFNPESMKVELPGPAAFLASLADGSVAALGGAKSYSIDSVTGEVTELAVGIGPGGGGGIPGGGAPGAGGAPGLQIDLGDGLTSVLSFPVGVGQGVTALVVGNDANKPTRAKLALLGANFAVTSTRDFPASWLPLVPPAQPAGAPGGGGGGFPGQPGGGPGGFVAAFRLPTFYDAPTRSLFVLARKDDGSAQGLVAFSGPQLAAKAIPFPAGWFATTCSPNVAIYNLELSRRLAMFGSKRAVEEVLAACPAQGYLALDFATQTFSAVPLPGVGEVNTRAASGEVNDFLFASNTDAQNAALSDTLYIYDSVAGSPFRLDLPAGIVGFQQVTPVPALNGLVATAISSRVAGDGGLVYFNLETEKTTVFPVPEGFQTVTLIGIFQNTRKMIARGNKANGNQYLIYDLVTGNLIQPTNPDGVAYVGVLPAVAGPPGPGGQPGGGGQPQVQVQGQVLSQKSNTIVALGYDAARNPVGLVAIKVP